MTPLEQICTSVLSGKGPFQGPRYMLARTGRGGGGRLMTLLTPQLKHKNRLFRKAHGGAISAPLQKEIKKDNRRLNPVSTQRGGRDALGVEPAT